MNKKIYSDKYIACFVLFYNHEISSMQTFLLLVDFHRTHLQVHIENEGK